MQEQRLLQRNLCPGFLLDFNLVVFLLCSVTEPHASSKCKQGRSRKPGELLR